MIKDPFDDLGKPREEDLQYEEVGNSFACQERGCYSVVNTAKYFEKNQLLTWKCKEGHINSIENFRL